MHSKSKVNKSLSTEKNNQKSQKNNSIEKINR
jgi:hypothetical protein